MAKKDDDILDSYDDDEPEVLSYAEQEKRQAGFLKEVETRRTMLKKPKHYPPKERVAAAYWLGEAGEPSAIPELVLVYNKDKTPGMKEAATYALGMFKALQEALDDPEMQDDVLKTTERIVLHGEFGERYQPGKMRLPQIGLLLSFIVLAALGGMVSVMTAEPPEVAATRSAVETASIPTPTEDTFDAAVADLSAYYNALDTDAEVLRVQMSLVTQGESQDCAVVFTNPAAYTLSAARQGDPNLGQITDQLNQIRDSLIPVRDAFVEACNTNTAIDRGVGLTLAQTVTNAQRSLRDVSALFSPEAGIEPPPTAELTAIPTATETPVVAADISSVRQHVDSLQLILDGMIGFNGDAATQVIWWQNIIEFGSSEGCFSPETVVPPDYDLPQDAAASFPDLAAAAENVNVGLALMRETSATFFQNCAANDAQAFAQAAPIGLERAQLAVQAFTDAQTNLNTLQGR